MVGQFDQICDVIGGDISIQNTWFFQQLGLFQGMFGTGRPADITKDGLKLREIDLF